MSAITEEQTVQTMEILKEETIDAPIQIFAHPKACAR